MKIFKIIIFIFVVFALLSGCNKKADEQEKHKHSEQDQGTHKH